jgi:hypothetical protein
MRYYALISWIKSHPIRVDSKSITFFSISLRSLAAHPVEVSPSTSSLAPAMPLLQTLPPCDFTAGDTELPPAGSPPLLLSTNQSRSWPISEVHLPMSSGEALGISTSVGSASAYDFWRGPQGFFTCLDCVSECSRIFCWYVHPLLLLRVCRRCRAR